jgi:hypothetical protein
MEPLKGENPTKKEVEFFVEAIIELNIAEAYWINQFVDIVRGFNQLNKNNPEFIDRLGKSDVFLQEFIIQTGNMYKNNKLNLNVGFLIFINIHRNKLKKILNQKEIKETIEEGHNELELALNKVVPAIGKLGVSRKTAQRYLRSLKLMIRANKKIIIPAKLKTNLDEYLLPELKPLVLFINEQKTWHKSQRQEAWKLYGKT